MKKRVFKIVNKKLFWDFKHVVVFRTPPPPPVFFSPLVAKDLSVCMCVPDRVRSPVLRA